MLLCFSVFFEVVDERLPTITLHFNRVLTFWVKGLGYQYPTVCGLKVDAYVPPVRQVIFNSVLRFDQRVGSFKIKSHASVFC